MRYVINKHFSLAQQPEGPLEPFLRQFSDVLSQQGFTLGAAHYRVRIASCFSYWLGQQNIKQSRVATEHCQQYLHYRYQQYKPRRDDNAALLHFLDFLRIQDAIQAENLPTAKLTAIDKCVHSYERYLYEVRGVTKVTVSHYAIFVRSFLEECFGTEPVKLSCLRAIDVVKFVQIQAPRLHKKRAKLMTSALRSFLKYTCYSGETTMELAGAVPVVPNWSMPSIPRGISTDQVNQLLVNFDQSTAVGLRDYAILLLLARLGLRLSAVTFLELNDINWDSGCLNVRGKGGRRHGFPLTHEVGVAITTYLQNGRPTSPCRRVFLRAKAPIEGFRSITGVSSIIRHALERHGIQAPTFGAHQFRHSLAAEMLRQGASLGEIGDVLGHSSIQTTTIYTKVDIEALRTLAVEWPGVVR